jgi:hypothetical protein
MTGWKKLDNQTLKINNKVLTLTKNTSSNNIYNCIDDEGGSINFEIYTFKNIIYYTNYFIDLII